MGGPLHQREGQGGVVHHPAFAVDVSGEAGVASGPVCDPRHRVGAWGLS